MSTEISEGSAPKTGETELGTHANVLQQHVELTMKKPGGALSKASLQATSEVSISDILQQETFLTSFSVDATTTTFQLFAIDVSPQNMKGAGESRVSYVSRMFRFWRGGMKIRALFTKTILQNLKLAFVFVPGATASTVISKSDVMMYSHKMIVNPSNESEIEFEIPFVADRPFLHAGESTGRLFVVLYQGFVGTLDTNAGISVDLFISGPTLELHEFDVLPATSGSSAVFQQTGGQVWSVYSANGAAVATSALSFVNGFLSDGGSVVITGRTLVNNAVVVAANAKKPVSNSALKPDTITYRKADSLTYWGTPVEGQEYSWRELGVCNTVNAAASANNAVWWVRVGFSPDALFFKGLTYQTSATRLFQPAEIALFSALNPFFAGAAPNSVSTQAMEVEMDKMREEIMYLLSQVGPRHRSSLHMDPHAYEDGSYDTVDEKTYRCRYCWETLGPLVTQCTRCGKSIFPEKSSDGEVVNHGGKDGASGGKPANWRDQEWTYTADYGSGRRRRMHKPCRRRHVAASVQGAQPAINMCAERIPVVRTLLREAGVEDPETLSPPLVVDDFAVAVFQPVEVPSLTSRLRRWWQSEGQEFMDGFRVGACAALWATTGYCLVRWAMED